MAKEQDRPVVMVGRIRHDSAQRWRRAYQWLWRLSLEHQAAIAKQEDHDASSGLVCPGINPAPGTGSHD